MQPELLLMDFKFKKLAKFIGNQKIGMSIDMENLVLTPEAVEDLRTITMLDTRNPFRP